MKTTNLLFLLFVSVTFISMATCSVQVPKAQAIMFQAVPGGFPTTVIGVVDLTERNGMVTFAGALTGLPPGDHGFHVHEFGDLSNGCLGAGLHYNPFRSPHGGPDDPPSSRHVGDLGNIMTPTSGPTTFVIHDSLVTFTGNRGIVGRAIVVHEKKMIWGEAETQRVAEQVTLAFVSPVELLAIPGQHLLETISTACA